MKVKILEFGYSFESNRHIMKFLIKGLEKEAQKQMITVLEKIPLGELKRFEVKSDTDEGLIILERFSEEEYPFKLDIPSKEKVVSVEGIVKKFISQGS